MTTVAVIPIKQLENAKRRLAGALTAEERKSLFSCMVQDVLAAASAAEAVDRIMVVTNDEAVAGLARPCGAEIMPEPAPPGLTEAVTGAGKALASEGVDTMLFLPGDVPLVTPDEIGVVLEGFGLKPSPEFLIVPAADLGGSNCVACSPPDCMVFGFGEDSFRRHLALARAQGIDAGVAKLPGIGLDVDTPGDLNRFLEAATRSGRDCHTLRYMVASGLIHKLGREAGGEPAGKLVDMGLAPSV